jgi:hypothetical protein
MADEDQRATREADVTGADRREAERGEGPNDSRHEQVDSCICSEGIRFVEAVWFDGLLIVVVGGPLWEQRHPHGRPPRAGRRARA